MSDPRQPHATRYYGVHLAIVKDTNDSKAAGRIRVWIPELGGNPNEERNWIHASYASPFAGSTPVTETRKGSDAMEDSQQSYGFWMQPPDVENHVLVVFANGDPARCYWFACVYQQKMNHSVPGPASNQSADATLDQQGISPPVVEYNKQDVENPDTVKRPVFEPLHTGLEEQGLYPDKERGTSSGGARRESPSKVFGYATPRGTSMMVDDNPDNEYIRLRTRGGTQVLVHETSGYVYINSKNGNSWMEISDEGIDVYSKKSISLRAEQDINFHADRDINLDGGRGIFLHAGNTITTESGELTHMKAGTSLALGAIQNITLFAQENLNAEAKSDLTMKAGGLMLRDAPRIHDNGPPATTVAMPTVKQQKVQSNVTPPIGPQQAASSTGILADATQKASKTAKTISSQTEGMAEKLPDIATKVGAAATKATEDGNTALGETLAAKSEALAALKDNLDGVSSTVTQQVSQAGGLVARAQDASNLLSAAKGEFENIQSTASGAISVANNFSGIVSGAAKGALGNLGSEALKNISAEVTGLKDLGLGTANAARAALATGVSQMQSTFNQLGGAVQHLEGLVGQAEGLLNDVTASLSDINDNLDPAEAIPEAVLGELGQSQQNLASAASSLGSTVGTAIGASNQLAGDVSERGVVKSLAPRVPTHEPWPNHVKEGQRSKVQSEESEVKEAIAAAQKRGPMGIADAVPSFEEVTQSVMTGTGEVVKKVTSKASPLLALGKQLVRSDVVSAIREAASTGSIDPGYLLAKASEMGFAPNAKIGDAVGLLQMTKGTFTDLVGRYGAQFGVGNNDLFDPRANALMGAMMSRENSLLLKEFGQLAGATELNLAHLMGPMKAVEFLTQRQRDGSQDAYAAVADGFARDHRKYFYRTDGVPRSLDEVYGLFAEKISGKAKFFGEQLDQMETVQYVPPFNPGTFA